MRGALFFALGAAHLATDHGVGRDHLRSERPDLTGHQVFSSVSPFGEIDFGNASENNMLAMELVALFRDNPGKKDKYKDDKGDKGDKDKKIDKPHKKPLPEQGRMRNVGVGIATDSESRLHYMIRTYRQAVWIWFFLTLFGYTAAIVYVLWKQSMIGCIILVDSFMSGVRLAVLPDSLETSRVVGRGAMFSGWLIAAYRIGCGSVTLILWHLLRRVDQDFVRNHAKHVYAFAVWITLLATVIECCIMWNPDSSSWRQNALLLVRFLQGCGAVHIFSYQAITLLTEPQKRVNTFLNWETAVLVCSGAGPLVGSVAHAYLYSQEVVPEYSQSPLCISVVLAVLAVAVLFFPQIGNRVFHEAVGGVQDWRVTSEMMVVLMLLSWTMWLNISLASNEGATAEILEEEYGWRGSEIGLALPFIFLSGVSLRFGVKSWGLSDANLFRVYASMGLVGSLLAGHPACTAMGMSIRESLAPRCDFVLLFGDSFFYPSVVLASAILCSWIMNMSTKEGIFCTANMSLGVAVACDGFPFLGAAVGRWIVTSSSRTMFLIAQFSIVALGWALLETALYLYPDVLHSMLKEEEKADSEGKQDVAPALVPAAAG